MIYEEKMRFEQPAAAETEGGRRPTGVSAAAGATINSNGGRTDQNGDAAHPDPQVPETPVRRRFTKAYKLDILQQIDACTEFGQIGAILRREGLYSSIIAGWRHQLRRGLLDAPAPRKRVATPAAQELRVPQLQRENARLRARLQQAELILEIQKKASEILGISLKTLDNEGNAL